MTELSMNMEIDTLQVLCPKLKKSNFRAVNNCRRYKLLFEPDLTAPRAYAENYNTSFCLNGGHCFQHPMVNNTVFHSCLCVNDYDGERCAYKSWNGDYVYTPSTVQRKVRMAHIVFSFPVLIMLSSLYVLFAAVFMLRNVPDYRRKQQQLHLHKQRFFVTC
ncbi:protein gurken-like [Drosophila subpulchrella]|uniref:protein gurken-like n=1 Tax=Drosophila subpulchrella TaxID=1486046 RepID=UPI0018A12DB0|nr:protein gurken-like [Drosophila subpulchrella]